MDSSTPQSDEEWKSDYERPAWKVNTRCLFHNGLPLLRGMLEDWVSAPLPRIVLVKKRPDLPSAEDDARRARFARVRLLNEELDKLTTDAAERTASVTNKASFLAVSAGVLVAASTVQLWEKLAVFGVAALALACVALACAAVAVRPGKRMGIQARRLVDRFSDSTMTALQIESLIIEDKANVLALREEDLRARAVWVWCGFAALALAAASLTVVFAAEVLGG